MAIKLSLSSKNFLNSFISHYISLKNTYYKNQKTSKFFIPHSIRGSLFGRPTLFSYTKDPHYSIYKLAKLYKTTYQKISKSAKKKQIIQLKNFKKRMSLNYVPPFKRQSSWSNYNLKKKLLFPAVQIKSDKIRSYNSLNYKLNRKAKKIYNNFYNLKNSNKIRNIIKEEQRLAVILFRAHWAISIDQANYWIKHKFISINNHNNKYYVNPGDIITPKSSIIPTIIQNKLIHLERGTEKPNNIIEKEIKIIIIRSPEMKEINVPLNMTKKVIL